MKKQGYTLAEVLVTLGIIGILAAIMLPLVNKLKPDSTKVMYLKTYDSLVEVLMKVAADENIYPSVVGEINYSKTPFKNLSSVKLDDSLIESNNINKLCKVLSYAFEGEISNESGVCSKTSVVAKFPSFKADFTAKNGVEFMVKRKRDHYYETDIYIDLNGSEGNNCYYNQNSCPNPDRFKFFVGVNGKIIPADKMGAYYLKTRTNLKAVKDVDLDVEIDDNSITFPDDLKKLGYMSPEELMADRYYKWLYGHSPNHKDDEEIFVHPGATNGN